MQVPSFMSVGHTADMCHDRQVVLSELCPGDGGSLGMAVCTKRAPLQTAISLKKSDPSFSTTVFCACKICTSSLLSTEQVIPTKTVHLFFSSSSRTANLLMALNCSEPFKHIASSFLLARYFLLSHF